MRRYFPVSTSRHGLRMTAMIDVVFLLLIFFVCTSSFTPVEQRIPAEFHLEGSLPTAAVSSPKQLPREVVRLEVRWQDGHLLWQVDGRLCQTLAELQHTLFALAAIRKDIPIVIDPEPDTPYEGVLAAYDICRTAQLFQVAFAASMNGE